MTAKGISNDLVLLDAVVKELQSSGPAGLRDDEFFEFFTFDQILKSHDLSDDELLDGQLGGGDEGGLDGLFAFADDRLLDENSDFSKARRGVELSIYVIQSKREGSFSETAVQKTSDTLGHLFDLSMTREELEALGLYHDRFVEKAEIIRSAIRGLANKSPQIKVMVAYASRGDTSKVNSKVRQRADLLVEEIQASLHNSEARFRFVGARDLYALSQQEAAQELELIYHQVPQSDGNSGYVALVELEEYFKFITQPVDGDAAVRSLRRYIFEGNVRDLERSKVNQEILETLRDVSAPQFWWLNNGVTIVCSEARMMNERLFLVDPLVVNGLQSSMVLFDYFANQPPTGEKKSRLLLVRVIQSVDPVTRDRVIRATNSQTPVTDATLRATDDVQRDIERFFLDNKWYYDRRKNFYRNQGKAADRVVAIPYLAQAVMSIGLSRANDARARPSSLLKDDKDYRSIFNKKYPLNVYLWAATTQRAVDAFLRSDAAGASADERTNLRFYLAMLVVALARGKRAYSPAELHEIAGREFSVAEMADALAKIREALTEYQGESGLRQERVVKGSEFVTFLLNKFVQELAKPDA